MNILKTLLSSSVNEKIKKLPYQRLRLFTKICICATTLTDALLGLCWQDMDVAIIILSDAMMTWLVHLILSLKYERI